MERIPSFNLFENRQTNSYAKNIAYKVIDRAFQDLYAPDKLYQRDARLWFFQDEKIPLSFYWWLDILDMCHLIEIIRLKINAEYKFEKCRLHQ